MMANAGYDGTIVDFYNSVSGRWSTAQLSLKRFYYAGTSVKNVAIFAGGQLSCNCSFALFMYDFCIGVVARDDACL